MDYRLFKDKVCIVTGAASGIGKSLSELLITSGAKVILIDKDARHLSEESHKLSSNAEIKICDVRDSKQISEIVNHAVKKYNQIDYIFNDAGIVIAGEERDIALADWTEVISTDLNGVVNGVFAAYPVMVGQGFGHIVNISSLAGILPLTIEISYVASKYAVVGLSHALRMEGKGLGVKVSVVCPGPVNTPIMLNSKVVGIKVKSPKDLLQLMPWFPKLITPEKAASIILIGVIKNKATILTDFPSRLGWWCYRFCPTFWMWLYEVSTMKRFREMRDKNHS